MSQDVIDVGSVKSCRVSFLFFFWAVQVYPPHCLQSSLLLVPLPPGFPRIHSHHLVLSHITCTVPLLCNIAILHNTTNATSYMGMGLLFHVVLQHSWNTYVHQFRDAICVELPSPASSLFLCSLLLCLTLSPIFFFFFPSTNTVFGGFCFLCYLFGRHSNSSSHEKLRGSYRKPLLLSVLFVGCLFAYSVAFSYFLMTGCKCPVFVWKIRGA